VTFAYLNKLEDTALDCKNVERAFCCSVPLTQQPETRGLSTSRSHGSEDRGARIVLPQKNYYFY